MAELTVSHYLGMLQSDPHDESAVTGLREAVASGEPARLGEQPLRLLEIARGGHERRGEFAAMAELIDIETSMTEDDPAFLTVLLKELARVRRDELLDDEGALVAYRRALELAPDDYDVQEAIEQLEGTAERFREIADRFVEESNNATDPTLKASMLSKAAGLVWQYRKKGKNKEVDELFEAARAADPSDARVARLYAVTLRARKKWSELAKVLSEAAENVKSRDEKVNLYIQAGRVYAKSKEIDLAAICYERVQDFVPGHDEALKFLVEYFTEREQWDHLVALYEDALRSRQKLESEQGILLQLAMVHWRIRNSPKEAEPYFAKVRRLDPAHPGMLQFYREHYGENDSRLVQILNDAQRGTGAADEKLGLAMELARTAEESAQPDRAIDAWKSVLKMDPGNREARAHLQSLYRRTEKWNALVELLRGEVETLDAEEQRAEKIALLEELVAVYRDQLRLDVMVINTYNQLLTIAPEHTEALDALSATYQAMGRWNDLINVLGRRVESVDESERIPIYMRIADLWIQRFANYNKATEPLEKVLELDGGHRGAIEQLKEIYTKKRAWKSLFDVQRREADLIEDMRERMAMYVELAKLAGERLHRHADAIALWKEIVAYDARTDGALDTLEKLAEREKDWPTLATTLEQRIDLANDDAERVKLLQKLGPVYGEHLGDPAQAARTWKRVLEIDPKNGRALRTLREAFVAARDWEGLTDLYGEANDWEGLVEVLGAAADRADDKALKIELSFRSAKIYEERIEEPHRALRSYERVLLADPKNVRAATALLPIYEREEKWSRLVPMLELLLEAMPKDAPETERLSLLARLRDLTAQRLNDPSASFQWASRAYEVAPRDASVVTGLEKAADVASAHDALAALYSKRVPNADADEQLELRRRIASLAGEKLGRPEEAITQLRAILESDARDTASITVLDRLYRSLGRWEDLRALFDHRLAHASEDSERWMLLAEVAKVEEEALGLADAASQRYRDILTIAPNDRDALEALDRLSLAAGRNEELADVLEKRVENAQGDQERVGLLIRLGDVRRNQLERPDLALRAYESALEAEKTNASAIRGLEAIMAAHANLAIGAGRVLEPAYVRTGAFEKLTAVLEARLAQANDEDEKRTLRLRLAEIASSELGDPSSAYASLEAAFLDRPDDMELWDRLTGAAEASGRHEDLARAFTMAIEAGGLGERDVADLSARIADVYDLVLGRPADAEGFHMKVLAQDALAERPFLALKELYTNQERWPELQALYRKRIAETMDAAQKLELLLQVCFLFEEILDDPEQAIRSYQDVLELEPTHGASRRALDRLYRRVGRYRELLELLRQDLDAAEGVHAIELTYEIGVLHELRLEEPEPAVDAFEQVLDKSPTHEKAQEALERLLGVPAQRQRVARILEPVYESLQNWPGLARVLDVELEEERDPATRVITLLRLAKIQEERLRDSGAAFDSVGRAVRAEPADQEARRTLARLAREQGRQRDRAQILEKAIDVSGETTYLVSELLFELALLWDEAERDFAAAERAYERLVKADPDNHEVVVPAARALERIHLTTGNYAALARDLRLQIRFENEPDAQKSLLVRVADLLEMELKDVPGAIEAHVERLGIDPEDRGALSALERLYEQRGEWDKLVETLQTSERVTGDPSEQRDYGMRIGAIYERQLDDVPNAIATYTDVIARFGREPAALEALARLYGKSQSWDDLLDVYEMQLEGEGDQGRRATLRFLSAELLRTRIQSVERAIEAYGEVLGLAPGHQGTIDALEDVLTSDDREGRVLAARVLIPHYQSRALYNELISALGVAAETDDPVERLELLRRAVEVADVGLQDPSAAFDLAGRAVRAALAEPQLDALLVELARHARAASRQADLVKLLVEVAPDVADADLQLEVLLTIAIVARNELRDPELAKTYYRRVLDAQGDHAGALDALDDLYRDANDHENLLEILRRKVEVTSDPQTRVGLLMRVADVCETKLGDLPAAIDALEEVTNEQPVQSAFDALERLYARVERWDDLVALEERMLEMGLGAPSEIRYRLGMNRLERLGDAEGAIEAFRANLEGDGSHEPTVAALEALMAGEDHRGPAAEILEPVFQRRMAWPKLIGALRARLSVEEDVVTRKEIHRRIGQIHEDHLEDLAGAMEAYAQLFHEEPTDRDAWDVLSRLARAQERFGRLAEIFAEALAKIEVDEPATAELARETGRLYDERVGDAAKAAPFYARALRFDPTDADVFAALESAYRRTSAWDDLLAVYRERVDLAGSDAERVDLLHRAADVLETQKHDLDGAIDAHRQAVETDPRDARSVLALDRLFVQLARHRDLADHLRFRADGAASDAERADLLHRLGELNATSLADLSTALDSFEEAVSAVPGHAPTVASLERLVQGEAERLRITQILEPLYRDADEWRKLIAIWEAQVALTDEASEQARLLTDIASMHERRSGDLGLAFHALSRAVIALPSESANRGELERIATVQGVWDELVATYEAAIEKVKDEDPALVSELLGTIARIHDERRGDPRSAIVTYERLIAHDASDATPLDALEGLHTLVGDWRGLVDVLNRKVELTYDPVDRAEIHRRAGSVLEELIGDPEGAISAYRRASEEDAQDPVALEALDRLYVASHKNDALADVLERRLEVETEASYQLEIAMRLGVLTEQSIAQPERAIGAYRRALELEPRLGDALAALARLHERLEQWPDLLDVLRTQSELAEGAVRVAFYYRIGDVLERRMREPSEAIGSYQAALELDARHEQSIQALVRIAKEPDFRSDAVAILEPLLRAQSRFDDLARLVALDAEGIDDPFEKKERLRALAEIEEQGRNDPNAAFDALAAALEQDPSDETIPTELTRLTRQTGNFEKLADVLAARAQGATDPTVARALWVRVAEVAEGNLRDDGRAIDAYQKALEQVGEDPELLAALDRLHVKTSRFEGLLHVLERRADNASAEERSALLVRLGQLRESRFEDARGAFAAYQEVLEATPEQPDALAALERMAGLSDNAGAAPDLVADAVEVLDGAYRQSGRLDKAARLYDAKITLAGSDGERVRLLQELAGLWEHDLSRPDEALRSLRVAFELDPRDEGMLSDVERLAERCNAWESLRGLAETVTRNDALDRHAARDLLVRSAGWYLDRLGDRAAGEASLRAAIASDPETLEAHERLVELLRGTGRDRELVAALRAFAAADPDDVGKRDRLHEAARVAESIGDAALAASCLEALLEVDASDPEALADLSRLRAATGDHAAVASLLVRRIEVEMTPDARLALRRELAAVYAGPLADQGAATTAYEAILEEDPNDMAAIEALETIYERTERWEDLRGLIERRLDLAETDRERIAGRVRLARLSEVAFGRRADAMEQLRDVLSLDPHNDEALDELERLMALEGQWDELVDQLESRASRASGEASVRMLTRIAEVHTKERADVARAIDAHERLLAVDPSNAASLHALVELHTKESAWPEVATAIERLLPVLPLDEARARAHTLAKLAEEKLDDAARAEAALRHALSLEPMHGPSRDLLKAFYERHGRIRELAQMLAEEAEATPDTAKKVDALKRVAAIHKDRLGDPAGAAHYLEQASKLVPTDRDILLPLCELYVAAGRAGDAVPVLQQIIASFGAKRSKELATYHHRLGTALEGMGDTAGALEAYDAAFKIDLTNVPILRDLGRLTHGMGDYERAQKTFRALLLQKFGPEAGITKGDVYFYLGDISAKQNDKAKAISMLERAIAEDKGHERASALLAQVKG